MQCNVLLPSIFYPYLLKTLAAYIIISRQPHVHFLSNKEKNKEKGYLKRQVFTSDKVFFYERYKRELE